MTDKRSPLRPKDSNTIFSDWTSTFNLFSKKADNQSPQQGGNGQFLWDFFLPQIPDESSSTVTAAKDPPHTPMTEVKSDDECANDNPDSSDDDSVFSEPAWSQVARRRSDIKRRATVFETNKEAEKVENDVDLDLIIVENQPIVKNLESLIEDVAVAGPEKFRRVVSSTLRTVGPSDLVPEVKCFDSKTGVFLVKSKININGCEIVELLVERVWIDFILMRNELCARIGNDESTQHLCTNILARIPRKRFRSVIKATARNVLKGARKGELKWQQKQIGKLNKFLQSAVNFVTEVKSIATFRSGLGCFEVEDLLLCFLCQGGTISDAVTTENRVNNLTLVEKFL
uniref:Uncharacterized protein n=1 Tax=Aureoumbra lagunensis TaxID=44058 RepID=A0A7S3JWT1_9STRA|mmetsp:Transcript_2007/g.2594  ORF Transcript_2007/g.2594 Transcript_2007/m.2594 type:complete len:343 (+) Transcript_2007:40-1068(+)